MQSPPTTSNESAPRRQRSRGAQPGNSNALRHGFYSRRFRQIELSDLDQITRGLEGEIAALRVFARRLADAISDTDNIDIETQLSNINGLGQTFIRIASLMRTHAILTGADSTIDQTLHEALTAIQSELTT